MRRRLATLGAAAAPAAVATALAGGPAWACAACVGWASPPRARDAYLAVTVLLSGLPLLIAGSLLLLYRSRLRRARRAGS